MNESKCTRPYEIELTNDEWRKTCSAEEFAEWISNLAYACMRCGMSNGEAYCHTGYCIQDEEDAMEWLKQPHTPTRSDKMKSCKNCEWAGYCTFDEKAVICEHDGSDYIPADKLQETAEKCADYVWLKQPHTNEE